MWIVRIALKRPYTFIVMAMLIVIMGIFTILRMPTDIFPDIDIPVISIIWNYTGLSPEEMEKRIVTNYERTLTTTVNDIEHVESQSLTGIAVVKVFFQPGVQDRGRDGADHRCLAERSSARCRRARRRRSSFVTARRTCPSCRPRSRATRSASSSSSTYGTNFVRADFATMPRHADPVAVWRQAAAESWSTSTRRGCLRVGPIRARRDPPRSTLQNVILPTGTTKMGSERIPRRARTRARRSSPEIWATSPIKTVRGTTVYIRDVANVRDGNSPQTNMVHVSG